MTTAGETQVISGGVQLRGSVQPPGDKSISHRALLLSALAEGESKIIGLSDGEDVQHTALALSAMGAKVSLPDDLGSPKAEVCVEGGSLSEPSEPLYLGNSGTSMRLLAGVCASHPMKVVLCGDKSLQSRPMDRIAEPLSLMGATVAKALEADLPEHDTNGAESSETLTAPIAITGGNLKGISYTLPVASAQVKGAILLAGLRAEGETAVSEKIASRAHTEEMLAECGADIEVSHGSEFHQTTKLRQSQLSPHTWQIPADPSQAAFWIVAALLTPGSDITAENVYLGQARGGFIEVLKRMGADISFFEGHILARTSQLTEAGVSQQEIPSLIDEIPVLAVAAAHAEGVSVFRGIQELRAKESDRVAAICAMLEALGGKAEAKSDTLIVYGKSSNKSSDKTEAPLRSGEVNAYGDHRIAMSAAVAAMAMPEGEQVSISGWDAVATSYPKFLADKAHLQQG